MAPRWPLHRSQPQSSLTTCLYARKSTESDEKQALSIDSQIKEMLALAQRENLNVLDIYREAHSAKDSGQKVVYNQLLANVRSGKFNGILVWHLDRLSRNAGDLGTLVDLFDQKLLIEIRTHSQRFTNNPNEKFLLMILGSQAKLENDNKGINVKRGLKTKCEMGLWPSVAPTGYLNSKIKDQKGCVFIDPERAPIMKELFTKVVHNGWSGRKIYRWLREIKSVTQTGKPLTLSNIYIILNNHFYHGTFEYPKSSGRWYQGKHTPIISKDLFDEVQKQLQLQRKTRGKNKEFAFTRIMSCGLCGSGVSADEKFKKLKDGTVNRYVYYGCTKFQDKFCKCGYVREDELIKQLEKVFDKVSLDEIGMKERIKEELEKHAEFQHQILGKTTKEKYRVKDVDIRNYAKYILRERSIWEKRELLSHLRSKLMLKEKVISML